MMDYQEKVLNLFRKSSMKFTNDEISNIEFTDFGLGDINKQGLNLIVYVNNDRYCAKEMVLLPRQTCPEHRHPDRGDLRGKQETFRCRNGKVYLYVEGKRNKDKLSCQIPTDEEENYTVFHEIELNPGEQYTIDPNIKHWFQAGDEGAVISEFSSPSDDSSDIFTNQNVQRIKNKSGH